MRAAALVVVLVLGCGTVTADPKDGAAGAGGAQAAAGAAGGAGELGGQGGAAAGGAAGAGGQVAAGGAGGELATTGPCAGLCSNPMQATVTAHVPLVLTDRAGDCYAITGSTAGYEPTMSCSPATMAIEINGRQVPTCTAGGSGSYPVPFCLLFLPGAPSPGTVTLQ